MSEMIRVLLVEDQQLYRDTIKNSLQMDSTIEVIAEIGGGEHVVELALQHKPDVVVMDVILPDIDGIDAAARIHKHLPDCGIVIVTAMALDIFHRAMRSLRRNGVRGFVSKNSAIEELRAAVHAVSDNEDYLSKDIGQYLLYPDRRNEIFFILDEFPDREFQALLLTTQGKCNKEISVLMLISQKTVNTYKTRVYDRLGINNDVQLIHWALHHNLVKRQYP
ncbi:MAG: response regulator transcription factor [Gammaproteobacteria bacterium]|nr:response regulator transcription factor [Gammaproteobacteria bacterium]